jgi:hypothetical protein
VVLLGEFLLARGFMSPGEVGVAVAVEVPHRNGLGKGPAANGVCTSNRLGAVRSSSAST